MKDALKSDGMGAARGETATYYKPLYELNYSRDRDPFGDMHAVSRDVRRRGLLDVGEGLEGAEVAFRPVARRDSIGSMKRALRVLGARLAGDRRVTRRVP